MATTALPVIEIAKNTWEIDEFDCGSIFVLEGEEKAMVIDTGTGIGDLRAVIAGITDKPLVLFVTHAHGDHIGGLGWFDEYYMNEADVGKDAMDGVDFRKHYAKMIADRSGKSYPYDMDADIRPWPAGANPVRHDLVDGQTFDLGGRVVTAMRAPGHTPGSMVLLDPTTRILFAGDACNCNTLYGTVPGDPTFVSVETAGKALKDIYALKGKVWDKCYNGHHDFRDFGAPLDDEVMPNLIAICDELVSGNYEAQTVPGMFPGSPDRTVVTKGTVMVTFRAEGIHEPK